MDTIPISIHSTARVETADLLQRIIDLIISIHSTARVETHGGGLLRCTLCYFNPLHREGGDPSITGGIFLPPDFNPLHREGGDAPDI